MVQVHYLRGSELGREPLLTYAMLRDRTAQFQDRLGWAVQVDDGRRELDQYDTPSTVYVIIQGSNGAHAGSLRLLPTTVPTMANDHFPKCLGGKPIIRPQTWECSRFCVAADADRLTSLRLLAACGRIMPELGISELLGIFDHQMIRAYRILGASPQLLGEIDDNGTLIHGGLWSFDDEQLQRLIGRAQFDPVELELWVANSSFIKKEVITFR